MFAQLTSSPFFIASLVLLFFGSVFAVAGLIALIRARIGSFAIQILAGLLLITLGGLSGLIAFGIQGYQSLTREEIAALISVSPIAPQRFSASFHYPDGKVANFIISGDEIYIDAHILKWQPLANLFGLHTAYELDRIGGRYRDIEQERNAERTIQSLRQERPVNLFALRQRYTFFSILLDAQYGSATFIPITQPVDLELRVSTTGLLLRELTTSKRN